MTTQKGKGYIGSQMHPENYHSVSPFDPKVGIVPSHGGFSEEFGRLICECALRDDRITAITAAMCEGTGLVEFSQKHAKRFFDVGIAEEHAVTFSAGLASKGMIPFFAVYSTFLQNSGSSCSLSTTQRGQSPLPLGSRITDISPCVFI